MSSNKRKVSEDEVIIVQEDSVPIIESDSDDEGPMPMPAEAEINQVKKRKSMLFITLFY